MININTTSTLGRFNGQIRKYTKSRTILPTDESLNKYVYLTTMKIIEKWTQLRPNWGRVLAELSIVFHKQLNNELA
ncbi:transposase [Clostridium guangxiense]|nr:transposase [Clostridium guangxiense]